MTEINDEQHHTMSRENVNGHQPIQHQIQAMHSPEFPHVLELHNCAVKSTMKSEKIVKDYVNQSINYIIQDKVEPKVISIPHRWRDSQPPFFTNKHT